MKVIFSEDFHQSYSGDPAAAYGRMEAILRVLRGRVTLVDAVAATAEDIAAVHTSNYCDRVAAEGVYEIAALAAGGAIQAATLGLAEPCFALIRPPGHHASAGSAWGFCYFNNMAIALEKLKREGRISRAFILDFDLHVGDGNVNILGQRGYATIYNPASADRGEYLKNCRRQLADHPADIIGVCAGFDNHEEDWGGLLKTEDYREIGAMVREAAERSGGGCFGILEGGYNHRVLVRNVLAFLEGMEGAKE